MRFVWERFGALVVFTQSYSTLVETSTPNEGSFVLSQSIRNFTVMASYGFHCATKTTPHVYRRRKAFIIWLKLYCQCVLLYISISMAYISWQDNNLCCNMLTWQTTQTLLNTTRSQWHGYCFAQWNINFFLCQHKKLTHRQPRTQKNTHRQYPSAKKTDVHTTALQSSGCLGSCSRSEGHVIFENFQKNKTK